MKFAISIIPVSLEPERDEWMMQNETRLALLADSLGFDMVIIGERHFSGVGGGNPFMTLANLAPQLKNAWLGTGIVTAPNYHPVRLAEMINIIDHLSKGKVIIGLGSGMSPADAVAFGFGISETSAMYHENVEALLELWDKKRSDPPVEIDNVHYKGRLLQRITPSPYRKPRPYLKTTAHSPRHLERAAREGWPVFFLCKNAAEAREPFHRYREALLSHRHSKEVLAHCMEWTSTPKPLMHVAETDEQAEREWEYLYDRSAEFRNRMADYAASAKEIQGIAAAVHGVEDRADPNFRKHITVHGSVETIVAHIREFEELGIGTFQLGLNTPVDDETLEMVEKTFHLFAERVMPRFKTPGKSVAEPVATGG